MVNLIKVFLFFISVEKGLIFMNKTITCCFCEKTVELTDDCQVLFGKDVCPECTRNLTRLVNKMIVEKDIKKDGQDA